MYGRLALRTGTKNPLGGYPRPARGERSLRENAATLIDVVEVVRDGENRYGDEKWRQVMMFDCCTRRG